MITKAAEKGIDYANGESAWRKNFIGVPYGIHEKHILIRAYKDGYAAACREIMELIESSKTPNVKVLLERIKE